jgi:hypothetical protein
VVNCPNVEHAINHSPHGGRDMTLLWKFYKVMVRKRICKRKSNKTSIGTRAYPPRAELYLSKKVDLSLIFPLTGGSL